MRGVPVRIDGVASRPPRLYRPCMFTLNQLARAIPLLAVALAPVDALAAQDINISCGEPYYDTCSLQSGWIDISVLSAGKIPADGVLLLQGATQGNLPGADSVSLTVATDGVPLAGAVELTDLPGTVIWRPATAWTAGATYQITGTATNPEADDVCLSKELPISGEVVIDTAPAAALQPVEISGVEMLQSVTNVTLETLACCPGVSPQANFGDCDNPGSVDYDASQCAPTQAFGYFDVTITGAPAAEGPVAQQVVYVLNADNGVTQSSLAPMFGLNFYSEPVCAAIDVLDLGSKTLVPGTKKCFGEALVDQLGPQTIDPGATLECAPQTCAVNTNGDGWDLEMCTPFDPSNPPTTGPTESDGSGASGGSEGSDTSGQEGEKQACACDATPSPGPLVLGLLGLLGLTRRRRRGR